MAPALALAISLGACTGDDSPAPEPTAAVDGATSASPAPDREADPGIRSSPEAGGEGQRDRVQVRDRRSRRTATGDVPGFVEIREASVDGDAGGLVFTVRLAGTVPQRTAAGVAFRVSFRVVRRDGERVNLDAQASENGWTATATVGERESVPVTLHVGAEEVQIEIDRGELGLGPFQWLASIAWTKGNSYGFDSAPERGYAQSPG